MPVACSSNALTGSSGAVYFVPAGTKACLLADDFASGAVITVTSQNDSALVILLCFPSLAAQPLIPGSLLVTSIWFLRLTMPPTR